MAYNTNIGKISFVSAASQSIFPFNFKIYEESNLLVYKTPSGNPADDNNDILILGVDYTVNIEGDNGGTITLSTGAAENDTVVIQRSLSVDRETEYQVSGDLLATTLNSDQDLQTYLIADNNLVSANAIKLPNSSVNISTQLPDVVSDAYLKWNADGDAIENDLTIPANVVTSTEAAAAALASEIAAALSESNASNSEDVVVAKEALVNPHYDAIDAVYANETNVNTVAGSITNVNNVSSDISNVDVVGSDLSNNYTSINDNGSIADAVENTTGISRIQTVATNINNVNTVANNMSDINIIENNLTEILQADTNAATATTQAGIATTKASEAFTSASNAASSASTATTQASNATSSASQASTSASNASASATSAGNSANSASNTLATFQGQYASGATEPTSPTEGDLWFDTVVDVMKVYDGSSFVAAYVSLGDALIATNNLDDLDNITTARTNLNVYSKNEVDDKFTNFQMDLGSL